MVESDQFKKELLIILNRMKNDAPIVFCTGKRAFKRIIDSNFLKKFNVFFQQKIAVNWFNYSLQDNVLKKIKK